MMKSKSLPLGLTIFLWSIPLLALGILALWITKTILKVDQMVVLACVVLAPMLLYLILSGRLTEVNLLGLSIKLAAAAKMPLSDLDEWKTIQVDVGKVDVIEKKAVEFLEYRPPDEYARYIVLTISLERPLPYDTPAILKYLKVLSQYQNCKFLVILDQS